MEGREEQEEAQENEVNDQPENDDEDKGEEKEEVEEEWEEEDSQEQPDPEEELLKISEFGLKETDFALRRPDPQFRPQYEAEQHYITALEQSQKLTGCIITPGIVYGYGESVMTPLFKKLYMNTQLKAPLYYGGHTRIIPFVHALDLAILIHAMCVE